LLPGAIVFDPHSGRKYQNRERKILNKDFDNGTMGQ
jgi:hypothetical protein